jgi:hypothetical protein
MTNRRNNVSQINSKNVVKEINLDAFEFIAKRNAEIMMCYCLIFITLIFSIASLAGLCYRYEAIKSALGL